MCDTYSTGQLLSYLLSSFLITITWHIESITECAGSLGNLSFMSQFYDLIQSCESSKPSQTTASFRCPRWFIIGFHIENLQLENTDSWQLNIYHLLDVSWIRFHWNVLALLIATSCQTILWNSFARERQIIFTYCFSTLMGFKIAILSFAKEWGTHISLTWRVDGNAYLVSSEFYAIQFARNVEWVYDCSEILYLRFPWDDTKRALIQYQTLSICSV